jgi:putative peptidoglycan lipid II flippase
VFALLVPPLLSLDLKWGAAGLTASAGIAGWAEFLLLRRNLNRRIGRTGLPAVFVAKLWCSAIVAAGAAWGVKIFVGVAHPIPLAVLALIPYGLVYFGLTTAFSIPESRTVFAAVLRRR